MMAVNYLDAIEGPESVRRCNRQPVDIFSWVQFTYKPTKQASIHICTHKLTDILGLLPSFQFRHINKTPNPLHFINRSGGYL